MFNKAIGAIFPNRIGRFNFGLRYFTLQGLGYWLFPSDGSHLGVREIVAWVTFAVFCSALLIFGAILPRLRDIRWSYWSMVIGFLPIFSLIYGLTLLLRPTAIEHALSKA
jgi:hypothetical protein